MPDKASLQNTILIAAILLLAGLAAFAAVWLADTTGRRGPGLGREFEYDLKALARVDPAMILYRELGEPLPTTLQRSRSISLGPDDTYLIAGDQAILTFDPQGNLLDRRDLDVEPRAVIFHVPTAQSNAATNGSVIPADNRGEAMSAIRTLYVSAGNHIRRYSPNKPQPDVWLDPEPDALLTSLTLSETHLYAADAANKVIYKYSLAGELLDRIGRPRSPTSPSNAATNGSAIPSHDRGDTMSAIRTGRADPDRNIPGLVVPSPHLDIAFGPDGLLHVVNPGRQKIEAYTPNGDLEFSWGSSGAAIDAFCGCCNPAAFALLPNRQGFITAEKGLTRVKEYDWNGRFVGVVAPPAAFEEHALPNAVQDIAAASANRTAALDLAVDSQGRVLVLDPLLNQVRIFEKNQGAAQ